MSVLKVIELWAAVTRQPRLMPLNFEESAANCTLYIITRRPKIVVQNMSIHGVNLYFDIKSGGERHSYSDDISDFLGVNPGPLQIRPAAWSEESPVQEGFALVCDRFTIFLSFHDIAVTFTWGDNTYTEHEVLYVGVGNTPNASARLKSHSTLQKILADNSGSDFDVFVTYVEVVKNQTMTLFGLDDSSQEVSGAFDVVGTALKPEEVAVRQALDYAEAALISHFQPPYNTHQLKFPENRAQGATELRKSGYTKVAVALNLANTGARMWSRSVPDPRRVVTVGLNVRPGNFSATTVEKSRGDLNDFLEAAAEVARKEIEANPTRPWMHAYLHEGSKTGARFAGESVPVEESDDEAEPEAPKADTAAADKKGMWQTFLNKFKRKA